MSDESNSLNTSSGDWTPFRCIQLSNIAVKDRINLPEKSHLQKLILLGYIQVSCDEANPKSINSVQYGPEWHKCYIDEKLHRVVYRLSESQKVRIERFIEQTVLRKRHSNDFVVFDTTDVIREFPGKLSHQDVLVMIRSPKFGLVQFFEGQSQSSVFRIPPAKCVNSYAEIKEVKSEVCAQGQNAADNNKKSSEIKSEDEDENIPSTQSLLLLSLNLKVPTAKLLHHLGLNIQSKFSSDSSSLLNVLMSCFNQNSNNSDTNHNSDHLISLICAIQLMESFSVFEIVQLGALAQSSPKSFQDRIQSILLSASPQQKCFALFAFQPAILMHTVIRMVDMYNDMMTAEFLANCVSDDLVSLYPRLHQ